MTDVLLEKTPVKSCSGRTVKGYTTWIARRGAKILAFNEDKEALKKLFERGQR